MTRVAVVGRGSAASRTLRILGAMGVTELVQVGSSPVKGFEEGHHASLDALSGIEVDWVFDCSPASTRVRHAELLAGWGLPTFFEKPLALSSVEGEKVLGYFSDRAVPVRVGYNLRRRKAFDFVLELLEGGSLGALQSAEISVGQYLPDWRPERDYRLTVSAQSKLGGGVLLELSHEINYSIGLWGRARKLSGITRNSGELEIDAEDLAEATLWFDGRDGPFTVSLSLDFLRRTPERWCRILGEEARVYWDLLENRVVISTSSGDATHSFDDSLDDTYISDVLGMLTEDNLHSKVSQHNADALHTLEVVDAWRVSSESGREVEVRGGFADG